MEKHTYEKEVAHIIASKSFGHSNTYANLLSYLVKCSINEDIPKETTIATEIFGKSTFDPSQSTLVRVYIYNLRNKLKNYYQQEGAAQAIILSIPKGSYKVDFLAKNEVLPEEISIQKSHWEKPTISVWLFLGVLITSLLANFYLWNKKPLQINGSRIQSNPPILWKDLADSKRSTLLVLGDLFIYTEYDSTTGLSRNIRDSKINDSKHYQDFTAQDQRKHISTKPLSYALLIRNSTECVKQVTELFQGLGKDFNIRNSSRFNPKELQDNDIIAVGMAKTLGLITSYFQNTAIAYQVETDSFTFTDPVSGQITYYKPSGDPDSYHKDYAIISKLPGGGNNQIYVFAGLWDTGVGQSCKSFTDPKLSQQLSQNLKNKFGEVPQYYEILIEVSGVDRMELRTKVVKMNKLEESNYFK